MERLPGNRMPLREPYDVSPPIPPETTHRADRAGRFIARVDAHLPTLCDDAARRAFLDRQLEGWEHRYARFLATEGASEPAADPADPPQAADFLLAITALAARRIALGGDRS
jgi:aminoglycoside phosphotransferase (APT) family kinase protein